LFNPLAGNLKVFFLLFDTDECSSHLDYGNTRRTAPHVRVANDVPASFRQFRTWSIGKSFRYSFFGTCVFVSKSPAGRNTHNPTGQGTSDPSEGFAGSPRHEKNGYFLNLWCAGKQPTKQGKIAACSGSCPVGRYRLPARAGIVTNSFLGTVAKVAKLKFA
jgi:hypothetical protein